MTARFIKPSLDKATYDPQQIADDAFARENHTGTQLATTISDLDTHTDLRYLPKYAGAPNGFIDAANQVLMTWSDVTRTVTLTPVGGYFDFYANGTLFRKTIAESIQTPDEEGTHYAYYDASGVLQVTSFDARLIMEWAIVAIIHWDATNNTCVPGPQYELHGCEWVPAFHLQQHITVGVRYQSGITPTVTIGDGSSDDHIRIPVTSGYIWDEDLQHLIPEKLATGNFTAVWRDGANGDWRKDAASPNIVRNAPSGRAYYNEWTGAVWQRTEMTDGYYSHAYLYATNTFGDDKLMLVTGQEEYASLLLAQAAAVNAPSLGTLPGYEFKIIATFIFQSDDTLSNSAKSKIVQDGDGADFVDWRFSVPTAAVNPSADHGNLTGLGDDDHSQYYNQIRADARYTQLSTFNANSVLAADTDNTPAAVAIGEQQILGRLTGGNIKALTLTELQTMIFGTALPENICPELDSGLSADGKWSGITTTVTYGETVVAGQVLVYDVGGRWWKAYNTTADWYTGLLAIALESGSAAENKKILLYGRARFDTAWSDFTISGEIWLSNAAGNLTQTKPTTDAQAVRYLGTALTAQEIFFWPSSYYFVNGTPQENATSLGAIINAATGKTTPVDADILGYADTEASNVLKKFTFTNLKAFLKTYFDGLYTLANLGGVPTSRTVNGHELSSNVTVSASDVGLSNVDNTSDANKPVSTAQQTALNDKVDENTAITGATKTKVTYDAKGLVTAGTDATTADIADSSNKRYVTDTQLSQIHAAGSDAETATSVGAIINGATEKATPVDADLFGYADTQALNIIKKFTWANVKSVLKTYFDSLYAPSAAGVTNGDSHNHSGGDGAQIAYSSLSGQPTIPDELSDLSADATHRTVTDTEKSTWNGKQDALGFTAENSANKKIDLTDNSDTYYPSQKAVKTAVDAKVDKSTFDANTILKADADNVPEALSIGEQTVVGRLTSGEISALTVTELQTLLFGAALPENICPELDSGLSADGKWSGIVTTGVIGESLGAGEPVVLRSDGKWWETCATNAGYSTGPLGVLLETATADSSKKILLWGKARFDAFFPTLSVGGAVYLGSGWGEWATTAPSTTGHIVRRVGLGFTANEMFFCPSSEWTAFGSGIEGAVLKIDYNAQTIIAATTDDTPAALTVGEQTIVGRITGGNIAALSVSQLQSLLFGSAFVENVSVQLDPALSADGTYSGITETGVAEESLAFGDLVCFNSSSSKWWKTIANESLYAGPVKLGICVLAAAGDGSPTKVLLWGKIRADTVFPTLTIGAPVYVATSWGLIQTTAPSAEDFVIRIIGYGNTANELFFCPDNTYMTYTV
jgi:hypothetical protein